MAFTFFRNSMRGVRKTLFFGVVFAAPGAVVIYTSFYSRRGLEQISLSTKQNAIISAVGPLTNIIIASIFLGLLYVTPNPVFVTIVKINSFLAIFNLLPIPPLDGSKVIWYNITWWISLITASVGLYILI